MMPLGTLRRYVGTILRPMLSRVETMIQRVVLTAVDDTKRSQLATVTALAGDDGESVEHAQPFGLSFRPTVGSEGVALAVGAEAAYRVVVAVQDRDKRPIGKGDGGFDDGGPGSLDLAEGEGGLYLDGIYRVFLASDGTVHLGAPQATDFAALASVVDAEIQRIWDTLTGWAVAPNDGGAALQSKAFLDSALVQSVASSKVKVEP